MAVNENACMNTYNDVERMIHLLCHRYCRGDWDDCVGVANVAYCKAYNTYDSTKSQFTTYCWHIVRRALVRHRQVSDRQPRSVDMDFNQCLDHRTGRLITRVVGEISDDAKLILSALLDIPTELPKSIDVDQIRQAVRQEIKSINTVPRVAVRRATLRVLRRHGWSVGKIVEGIDEIKDALR